MMKKYVSRAAAVVATVSTGAVLAASPAMAAIIPGAWTGDTLKQCAAATAANRGMHLARGEKVVIRYYCKKVHGVGYVTRADIYV